MKMNKNLEGRGGLWPLIAFPGLGKETACHVTVLYIACNYPVGVGRILMKTAFIR